MTGSGDAANACPLPLTAQGVTAAWLSAALRTRYPDVVITQAQPVQTIDGTATKVLLRLAYRPHTPRDGLPDQLCVKGGFGAHREYLGGTTPTTGAPTSSPRSRSRPRARAPATGQAHQPASRSPQGSRAACRADALRAREDAPAEAACAARRMTAAGARSWKSAQADGAARRPPPAAAGSPPAAWRSPLPAAGPAPPAPAPVQPDPHAPDWAPHARRSWPGSIATRSRSGQPPEAPRRR
jgi:hypothetical protein